MPNSNKFTGGTINRVAAIYGDYVLNQKPNCCETAKTITMNKKEIKAKVQAIQEHEDWGEDIYQIPDLITNMYARGYVESGVSDFDMEDFTETKGALLDLLDHDIWSEGEQEIQKQIEAVRGLERAYKALTVVLADRKGVLIDHMSESIALEMYISALTETLKPYLNGEKLEV